MARTTKFPWVMSYVSRKGARRKPGFFVKNVRSENWKRDGVCRMSGARVRKNTVCGRKNAGCGKHK